MPVLDLNWYTQNAGRKYPLDDGATGEDEHGVELPNDVIVDLRLRWPRYLGMAACVSSIRLSPKIVSVAIAGISHPPIHAEHDQPTSSVGYSPIARIILPRPVDQYRPYAMAPATDDIGIGGWIVFGPGVTRKLNLRFALGTAGLINYRSARSYPSPPVPRAGKLGALLSLVGIINMRGDDEIEVRQDVREIDHINRPCIVFRLKPDSQTNLLKKYAGPCGARPESGTCIRPGIETIGGIQPDDTGNLVVEFDSPVRVTAYDGGGGAAIDYPVEDVCGQQKNIVPDPNNPEGDGCNPVSEPDPDQNAGYQISSSGNTFGEFGGAMPAMEETVEDLEMASLPYVTDFADGGEQFSAISGSFALDSVDAEGNQSPFWSYRPMDIGRCISLWQDPIGDTSLDRAVEIDFSFPTTNEVRQQAGIVVNYHRAPSGEAHEEYFVGEVDRLTACIRLRLWTGYAMLSIAASDPIMIHSNKRYCLRAETMAYADAMVRIRLILKDADSGIAVASVQAATGRYLPADGAFGFCSEGTRTLFHRFSLEAI
jgi:hypothetical protein